MDAETTEAPPTDDGATLPWWQSKLNLGVLALAIAVLCGGLGTNPDLRDIAREIVFGQGIEIGRMIQLLRQFGATETNETETAMTWMNEPTPIDRMPGLASDADIDKLLASSGKAADQQFVALMVAHHQGGIHMAQYALDHANVIEVKRFAYAMITGQTGEISEMQALIAG